MNNQEYEQKKRECWEEFIGNDGFPTETMRQCFNFAFDRAYALGKQERDAEDDKTLKVNRQLFCRLCADADDYINEHLEEDDSDYGYYKGRSDALHELYHGERKGAEDTVISGWVARDSDGDLFIYETEPKRESGIGDEPDFWMAPSFTELDNALFPDLTWESEPEQVELIIKRKKK